VGLPQPHIVRFGWRRSIPHQGGLSNLRDLPGLSAQCSSELSTDHLWLGHSALVPKSRVVILNGASSSGKTTLAMAFRDQHAKAGDFWLLTGVDDFLSKLPGEWKSAGGEHGAFAADGFRFEATAEGLAVSVGPLGRMLLRAYQAGVGAASRIGLNVLVDEVMIDQTSWDDWTIALAGLDVVWVGIRCSAEVAEGRNRSRGDDRFAGLARAQTMTVHRGIRYDFEIDTTNESPQEALLELNRGLGY
jgi:chloramphenicol 3-O phosphotransferase